MIEVKTSNKERMINISGDINTLLNEVEGVLVKLYGGICSHNNKEVADKCLDELFARVKMSEEERAADTKESKEKVDEISENLAKL